jgi:hypothetical protein
VTNSRLATYLNDHLAGSEAGLELIEHIAKVLAGDPGECFATELKDAIAADRKALESLMARLNIGQSRSKRMVAWISEKFAELKVRLDDPQGGPLRRLELWEALSLGIEGKRLLWRSLASALEGMPETDGIDFGKLERRAEEQRWDVEELRVKAAKAALGNVASTRV